MHLSSLALWSRPTAFCLPQPHPALVSGGDEAHAGLDVTQGTGVGGHRTPLPVFNQDDPGPPAQEPWVLLLFGTSFLRETAEGWIPVPVKFMVICVPSLAAHRCGFA